MRLVCVYSACLAAVLFLNGCDRTAPTNAASTAAPTSAVGGYLNHAQPKLATLKLWLGDQELVTEIARSGAELQTGMMYRTNMAENEAMLFVFGRPMRSSFYMRNTKVPLSCAYIDPDGTIQEVHDLKPLDEQPVEAETDRIQFVLETTQGWFKRHNLGAGAAVRTQYGPLSEINWMTLKPIHAR